MSLGSGGRPWPQNQDRLEEFGFTSITFEYPLDGQLYDAWIIYPSGHGASYFSSDLVEIIASELIGGRRVERDSHCAINLDHTPSIGRPPLFGDNNWCLFPPKSTAFVVNHTEAFGWPGGARRGGRGFGVKSLARPGQPIIRLRIQNRL